MLHITIMRKLDLHGITHDQVSSLVQDWVITEYNNGYRDLQIITGKSEKMIKIASEALTEAGFKFRVGDYFGENKGFIQVL